MYTHVRICAAACCSSKHQKHRHIACRITDASLTLLYASAHASAQHNTPPTKTTEPVHCIYVLPALFTTKCTFQNLEDRSTEHFKTDRQMMAQRPEQNKACRRRSRTTAFTTAASAQHGVSPASLCCISTANVGNILCVLLIIRLHSTLQHSFHMQEPQKSIQP